MAMDAEAIWQAQWDLLPLDPTGTAYPMNLANFVGDRVDGKLSTVTITSSASFTFNRAVFAAGITGLPPSPTPIAGATAIATAWQTAIVASTMTVPPGAFIGSPAPSTTYSVVFSSIPIPGSGFSSLVAGLIAAPLASGPMQSAFPKELRKAFGLLTYTVSGLTSNLPPPVDTGPLPLVAVTTVA